MGPPRPQSADRTWEAVLSAVRIDDVTSVPNEIRRPDALRAGEARHFGVGLGSLRGTRWSRVSHGLYRPGDSDPQLIATCRALGLVLPRTAVISHFTAARLYDVSLPQLPAWLPVMASAPPRSERPERRGLYVARSRAQQPVPHRIEGVHVVPPEVCIGQLAEDLSLVDLVIALDSALHVQLCSIDDVIGAVRRRQRGLPRLRRAVALCDGRSESPWETVLRLIHVAAGIAVEPQYHVYDSRDVLLARADLRIAGTRRLPEYDGADHRTRDRHERDLEREKGLARDSWERYGYIAREIIYTPGQVILDGEDALGWAHDRRRLLAWLDLASDSTLTAEGKRRLLRRLHRFAKPLRGRRERPSTT